MRQALKSLFAADLQTFFFILTTAIYIIAILWTTIQSYARLEYSRTGSAQSTAVQSHKPSDHS